ncbi:MAG: OadG family protein [Campylobacterales bacterium]|nr:OadG family protein [Campylobacterales bacterium]
METNLVLESLKFMVLGMGVVFLFLYLLVLLMQLQAFIVGKFFSNNNDSNTIDTKKSNDLDEKRRIAAIIGAVMQHKK